MEAFTSDKECLYYMKLLTFTLGIGMDVLHNYFEQKILNATEFYVFLETHKHYLFHECYPRVQCCCCSKNFLASSSKSGCLNKSQFQLLFDIASPNENDHCQIGRHNGITKDCLCRIDANRSNEVDCMDITLMCAIIKSCFVNNNKSIHGNPRYFETIKNTRNFLAHVPDKRISESDFNSKWDEMEQAILAIAGAVGNYFAKANKRKINEFKSNELSMEKIKEIIESNADDVKKNLRALIETQKKNTLLVKHVKDEIIEQLTKHKDELSVDIGKLRFEVKQYSLAVTPSSQEETLDNQGRVHKIDTTACVSDVKMSGKDKDVNKCRLEWRLEAPETWNLTEIKETLERFSGVLRPWFEIQFVYIGSLVIKTLVQKKILNDRDQMRTSVHSFLEKFVEVCQINTDVPKVIKIALIVEPDAFDYEDQGERHRLFRASSFIVNQSAIDLLEAKLSDEGLSFRGDIPNDGNSFFRSCSDQLERLEMLSMDHAELRQKIAQQLRGMPTGQIYDARFTNEEWNTFIKKIAEDGEHIEDVVVEKMAKLLKKKIVIYSLSSANEISKKSINDEASGTPLLLGKEKSYYTSLESKDKQKACQKRPAKTVQFADDVSLAKQSKQEKEVDRNPDVSSGGNVQPDKDSNKSVSFSAELIIKSSTPVKILQAGPSTEGTPTKTNTKQVNTPMKKITKDEKVLILSCYYGLKGKGDWNTLSEMVYSKRQDLSREIVHHYEQNLDLKTSLKNRIKDYILRVKKDKGENEKDHEVKTLIQLILIGQS